MERRLRPLNALLGLVIPGDVNRAALAAVGFRLAGLEVPVTTPQGTVTVDVILFHEASTHLLLCEAKSGANVDTEQAIRYATVEPGAVVHAAHITLPHRGPLTAEAVYVCHGGHLERIKQSLRSADVRLPVLGVHSDEVVMEDGDTASGCLRSAFVDGPIPLRAPPQRLIAFDHDSPVEQVEPFVKAQLIASLASRIPHLTISGLTERAAPHYGLYGRRARNQLVKRVESAIRSIVQRDPETFAYDPPTANRDGLVRLLKTPEDNDTRGRTQAYQALARKGHTGRRRPTRVDPNQLDLLQELDRAEDVGDEDDTQEEVTP